jgi:hypothetical protein
MELGLKRNLIKTNFLSLELNGKFVPIFLQSFVSEEFYSRFQKVWRFTNNIICGDLILWRSTKCGVLIQIIFSTVAFY